MPKDAPQLLPHELAANAVQDAARPEAVARQHARGKRTARERIAALLDPGTFREIGVLARPDRLAGEPDVPADAIVTGTGEIDGRPVVVLSTDFSAAGGSNGLIGNEKQRRAWEIAATRGMPVVMLFDGGGHRIQEGLDARIFTGGFDIQEMQTRLSGWVPMVAAMLGAGYGQPTLSASMCDFVVAVRGMAKLGMAPPSLVRVATGEDIGALGLDEPDTQAGFGTVDQVVDTEQEAIEALQCYLSLMPSNAEDEVPAYAAVAPDPAHSARLDDIVPADSRAGYDMYEVLSGLVDDGSMVELKAGYAPNIVTALVRIAGRTVGVIANQPLRDAGALDAAGAEKASHLVSLCDAFAVPVLTVMDLPGLAVGSPAERSGLARRTARLALELGAATVPTFTVVARKGFGGGYVIMSGGRTFRPELVLGWPHAQTAVMAVGAAVDLVYRRDIEGADDPEARRSELIETFEAQIGILRGAEGFGVDDVCRPSETRARIAETLSQLPRRRMMQNLTPRRHGVAPL